MSDEVYLSIAKASSGFVESPAGCGKTEAIVRTVGGHCVGTQLVLTHTHAGVDALQHRFRKLQVPSNKYHVDTIAGWAWNWVRKYPSNSSYSGSTEIAVWNDVYAAMVNLLHKDFVKNGVLNSYAGIIVDEYQDCTSAMHKLVIALKELLPCRVLGDDLQGIFNFAKDPLVSWSDVKTEFANDLGVLDTPYRWLKEQNEPLGLWLLNTRSAFRQNIEPDYGSSPITRLKLPFAYVGRELIRLTHEKEGRICVIGPKARPLSTALETTLVNHGYRVLEPNDLTALRDLIIPLTNGTPFEKSTALIDFLGRVYGGLGEELKFIEKLSKGENQNPRKADRKALCQKYRSGLTPNFVIDVLEYVDRISGTRRKLYDSVSALRCIVEEHLNTSVDLRLLYAREIARRKNQNRSNIRRSIGSTLLVKGLEYEHAIIVRGADWQKSWGSYKDLYVALTRATQSTTLVEYTI